MSKWMVAAKRADFQRLSQEFGISPVLARIIRNRDVITDEEMRKFLYGTMDDLYAPELLKDMNKAMAIKSISLKELVFMVQMHILFNLKNGWKVKAMV